MTERSFTERHLAALYDLFHPPKARDDLAFYLPLSMAAPLYAPAPVNQIADAVRMPLLKR